MASWNKGYRSDIPYLCLHFIEQTPDFMDLALLRSGIHPPVRHAGMTYLELGCGHGYTANIVAACHPEMTVHAVDFMPDHIAAARELAEEAGLANIHFHDVGFEEFLALPGIPQFDYITLHGVWSWVSSEVRAQIVSVVAQKLRAGGAFYMSYNALPGSAAALPLQRLYLDLHRFMDGDNLSRIASLMTLTDKFIEKDVEFFKAHPKMEKRHTSLKKQSTAYFAHEYLNENWQPFFLSDVCGEFEPARVAYAASADLASMTLLAEFELQYADITQRITDPIIQEQLKDYVIDNIFRKDIFVRGPRKLTSLELMNRLNGVEITLLGPPERYSNEFENSNRTFTMEKEAHAALLKELEKGSRSLGELAKSKGLSGVSFSKLVNLACCAIQAGQIAHLRDRKYIGDTEPAKRFNQAVLRRTQIGEELGWLASPLAGYGIHCNQMYSVFYMAMKTGGDPVEAMMETCKAMHQSVMRDGKPITDVNEAVKALKEALANFKSGRYKYLEKAGIAA